jgi:hypothetical protein
MVFDPGREPLDILRAEIFHKSADLAPPDVESVRIALVA